MCTYNGGTLSEASQVNNMKILDTDMIFAGAMTLQCSQLNYDPQCLMAHKLAHRPALWLHHVLALLSCLSLDLEKAFDTVPRKMAMATLRWMGAPESEVKMVEAMYENTTGRVVVGSWMSNEFQVNIGLRQGSALSPLLFILVMDLISRKISTTDAMKKIMYADDLVIVAEHWEELQGALEEWNEMFKKHGLKMNLDKTEVMWVGKHREEQNIRLEGYLGGNISENGRVDVEVRRRIQAGANAWRNVEGVMMDRKISRKLKGKVLDSCVVPASTYGLETLALSELHQHKLQVCENKPDEMGWTHGQNERWKRNCRKDPRQWSTVVAENEEDHS